MLSHISRVLWGSLERADIKTGVVSSFCVRRRVNQSVKCQAYSCIYRYNGAGVGYGNAATPLKAQAIAIKEAKRDYRELCAREILRESMYGEAAKKINH